LKRDVKKDIVPADLRLYPRPKRGRPSKKWAQERRPVEAKDLVTPSVVTNTNPDNTQITIKINGLQWTMIEYLRGQWGCSRARVVRRLLRPYVKPMIDALKEQKETVGFRVEIPLDPKEWKWIDNFGMDL
jgi:hypothetical protein